MAFTTLILGSGILIAIIAIVKSITPPENEDISGTQETEAVLQNGVLIYKGAELQFSDELLRNVLIKHFPYFHKLQEQGKEKFLSRLKHFIQIKSFVIHDKSGFREMPILTSAAAIKLSFGLERYTLPHYKFIHIFPAEFIGIIPTLRVLVGNVSGNSIHISWRHFLEGFQCPDDGQNVGLHEMAHAYYFQYFETGMKGDLAFIDKFPLFSDEGKKVFELEKTGDNKFYSTYAATNFHEFWAESIELFFERPVEFNEKYPTLYAAIVDLLNQDPSKMAG